MSSSITNESFEIREKTFENATGIRILNLERNHIKALNVHMFKNMRKIEDFAANDNLIEKLDPKLFQGLIRLTNINLKNNYIIKIKKDTFVNLNLIKLNVENNCLSDFDFANLKISDQVLLFNNTLVDTTEKPFITDLMVKILDLSSNKILKLNPKFMQNFKKLEIFNGQTNLIAYLHSNTFDGLLNLKDINL